MALTSTEVVAMLGVTTTDSRITQIETVLPYITRYINDYCNGFFSRQVKEEEITFTSATTTTPQQLDHYPVIEKSVYVTSTNRGTYFYGDTQFGQVPVPSYYIPSTDVEDYALDYSTGGIFIKNTTNSQIKSTESILVTYAYIDLNWGAKPAASKMIQGYLNKSGGIASESAGGISVSYFNYGMDSEVAAMLAPYKKVNFA